MTRDAPQIPSRRRLLQAVGASALATAVAGCGQQIRTDTDDRNPTRGETATDAPTETEPTEPETEDAEDTTGPGGTLTVGASRNWFFDGQDAFDRLEIGIERIELRPVDGDPVRIDVETPSVDLTELEGAQPTELVAASIPPGPYAELALSLPVVDAALTDGDGPVSIQDATEHVFAPGPASGFTLEADDGTTFELVLGLQEYDGSEWQHRVGYGFY